VAFAFTAKLLRYYYAPRVNLLVLFKAVFLQFLYGLSNRQREEHMDLHLTCE